MSFNSTTFKGSILLEALNYVSRVNEKTRNYNRGWDVVSCSLCVTLPRGADIVKHTHQIVTTIDRQQHVLVCSLLGKFVMRSYGWRRDTNLY